MIKYKPLASRSAVSRILWILAAMVSPIAFPTFATAQIATLDKGHQLLVDRGLQIWGCDTGASSFTYSNLTGANMNAVMWSFGQSNPGLLSTGQKWGKWVSVEDGGGAYLHPNTALNATETAHINDLISLQVGDEQQVDIEDPNGKTKQWFIDARAANLYTDKLLYVNSFYINSDAAYATFIANANPDAISFDSYPFGSIIPPYNWLGKAQQFRRHALGSYINPGAPSPRPYGLYLQMYNSTSEGARDPGDLEMRWQQFTAWTLGYTFVDNFTVGGSTSMFIGGSMANPNQPRYNQFKESARQSMNLGPALTKLISYSNGPAGGGTSVVRGRDPSGALNAVPLGWQEFNVNDAPPNQRYLTGVSAVNLGTKNNGQPGDVYVGFFNPLLTSYGDPAGTAYFMVTNALGAYLQDPTLLVTDCTQQITLDFNFGVSGINSLQRLSRNTGQVEVIPLTHVTGSQYRYIYNLEGGTGDLFKYNDGSPFVGIEQPLSLLYWDNDGVAAGNNTVTGAGLGGGGTWNAASAKWFNGSTDAAWVADKTAVFWGTAGAVTLAAPQSADGLQFKSHGYTLTGSTLTMSGSDISVDSGMTATINSTLAGSTGINKTGAGTLVLGGPANSYTAGTTISGGALRASADGNLGAAPGGFTAGNITLNGGALQFGGNFDISNNRGITLGAAGGTIDTQGFTNPSGYNATQGGFQGPGDLTKLGSGTFFAAATTGGANTLWKGRLIIKEGIWKIVATDGLPYNAPLADGLQPGQVTLDGGTWQIGATINATSGRRGVTVAAGGGTVDTQSFNLTWNGPWAGSVTTAVLDKIGSGTLRLNSNATYGPATYAGNLNVNGGIVQLDGGTAMGDGAAINLANIAAIALNITGAAETIGSLAGGGTTGGNVSLGANLNAGGNNNSTTYGGVISGVGGFTKAGTGTMTLTGANTYTGGTTVSSGTLRVNNTSGSGTGTGAVNVTGGTLGGSGTISGAITVGSGGHLAPGNSPGTLATSSSATISSGAALDYDLANVTTLGGGVNDLFDISGGLTLSSSVTLNINAYQGDVANGTYTLMSYSGGLTGSTAGWSIGSSNASGTHGYSFSTATPGQIQLIITDATPMWTGAVSTNWDTGGNWSMNVEPSGSVDVVFPTPLPGTGGSITLTSGEAAKSLTFNDSYSFNGGDLTLATGNVNVAGGKTATIASAVMGSAGLTKNGAGTLVLFGSNTYGGGTNINAGTLRVGADANLGNGSGGVFFDGGTLHATASFSTARPVIVNSGGGAIASGFTTTLAGTLGGAAGNTLTKTGSGTLVLAQATPRSGLSSSWLGNITVTGGTLKVGNGGSSGYLPGYDPIAYAGLPPTVPTISLADGTTLEFNHAAGGPTQDTAHAVVISGFGGVVISGAKTEVFVANNTYTGSTFINSGSSLRVGWGGSFNTGGLGATWVHNSGALTFSNDHNTTFPGLTSGSGTLLKEYSGTLTITGSIDHTGGTTIASGTLQIGSDGTTGSISGSIANNATLAFQRSNTYTHAGVISGSGAVIQRGAGTLVLTGANSYTGGTTITSGKLLANNSSGSATGSGGVVVAASATLGGTGTISGHVTVNNGGHIAPGASIESLNVGNLTLAIGSVLDFELDTVLGVDQSDLINVTTAGGLTINGGTLVLTNLGSMTGGTYTLIDYNGTLGGSLSNLTWGSVPSGFNYSLVNNTSNTSIDLIVEFPGDHNGDGTVDAADYVVWRTSIGTQEAYEAWRSHFGQSVSGGGMSTGVPEPATWLLLVVGVFWRFATSRGSRCMRQR